jgi:hypothetical protein
MEVTGQKVRKRGYSGARLELIKKAASLSLEEYTIPEIARELRISDSKVRRLLSACEGLPTSCLSETAQVARLLDLERLDGVLSVAFPVALGTESATDERSGSRDKTSLRERKPGSVSCRPPTAYRTPSRLVCLALSPLYSPPH